MSLNFKETYQAVKDSLIKWASQNFPRYFYRYLYREHLIERHRYFDVSGLVTKGNKPLESERIFVPLHLTPKSVGKIKPSIVKEESDEVRQEIWRYLSLNNKTLRNLAIVAGPGFGKSTLLRHITLMSMAEKEKRHSVGVSFRLPILLFLREHALFIRSKSAEMSRPITDSIPPQLYGYLRHILITYGPFSNAHELTAIFVDSRINPWRDQLPEANTKEKRVEAVIHFLHNQYESGSGKNALVLFLQVLIDLTDPNIAYHADLSKLVNDLSTELILRQNQQTNQYNEAEFNATYSLLDAVQYDLKKHKGPLISPKWFSKQLQKGNCVIMLDGLDEIPNSVIRKQAAAWIEAQIVAFPGNQFILSSRPISFKHAQLNRFHILEVMSFNQQQVKQFVVNWYLANETHGISEALSNSEAMAHKKADDFLDNLFKNERLIKLATNPLLLTMMIYVHRYRKILPQGRAELFHEVIQVLFERRKGYLPEIPAQQKQQVLQPLAFTMMQQREQNMKIREAVTIAKAALRSIGDRTAGSEFLQAVESSAGLLREEDRRSYRFAHLTFQEYLAAVYAKENKLGQTMVDHVSDEWWHETITLYSAQTDATHVIRACLADGRLSDLTFQLALNCLEETPSVSNKVAPRLEKTIKRCLDDSKLTHIVSNALSEIRKNRMVRISARKFIDSKHISHAEYQVFLHEKMQQGEYYQPDHWCETTFPDTLALKPIVGIRSEDADVFCRWLTEREAEKKDGSGGLWRFRLPQESELQGRGLFGLKIEGNANYWVYDNGNYVSLGAVKPQTPNLDQALGNLLGDTSQATLYDASNIFPNSDQMLDLLHVKQSLSAFDFSQIQSHNLIQAIQQYTQSLLPEIEAITAHLAPLAQFLDEEASRFNHVCRQIAIDIQENESQIRTQEAQLNAAHSEISANYRVPYQQIDQLLNKYGTDLTEQKNKRQEQQNLERNALASIEDQWNEMNSDIQAKIANVESSAQSENQRIQAHYGAHYAHLDQERARIGAEIQQLNNQRDVYTESSINQAIKQYEDNLEQIEDSRRATIKNEQQSYQSVSSQVNDSLSSLDNYRKSVYEQVKRQRDEVQSTARKNYDIIDQNIKTIESGIKGLKDQRKQLNKQEQQEKESVATQVNINIAMIREHIDRLSSQQNDFRSKEQNRKQNAELIQTSKTSIGRNLNMIGQLSSRFDDFFKNYFAGDVSLTIQLETEVELVASRITKLIQIVKEFVEKTSQTAILNHLQRSFEDTQDSKRKATALRQIIENSLSLRDWTKVSQNNFQALTMPDLPQPLITDRYGLQLHKSLELAYNFLRYRRRQVRNVKRDHSYAQLQYTRLCVLGNISHYLMKAPSNRDTHSIQQYMELFVMLQILEARMRGEVQAFEGIRLMKYASQIL